MASERQCRARSLSGLNEGERRAYMLADNKLTENAGWDRAALAKELSELTRLLPECDLGIEITGFETSEIDAPMLDLVDTDQDPVDELPEISGQSVSRLSDLPGRE